MNDIEQHSKKLATGILQIIEAARRRVAVYLNSETTQLYWEIGMYINREILTENRAQYGAKILATVSQELTLQHGKGFTYTSLTRMSKVAHPKSGSLINCISRWK